MRHSTTAKRDALLFTVFGALLCALFLTGLFVGKYPLTIQGLMSGDELQVHVFTTLRLSRVIVGTVGGFALGIAGFVYQTIFKNPLASPDIIGVSSGASAGAAAGILFFSGAAAVTLSSFMGALVSVILVSIFSAIDRSGRKSTVVLAGIAVHSIAQTALMCLKLTADPEKELASIEYWIMGSLNAINSHIIGGNLILCMVCLVLLIMLHRQSLLLSAHEDEARLLGVDVSKMRMLILILATLTVSGIVSMTGLISFVGLLAPHCAKKLMGDNSVKTMLLGGIIGGCILTAADILARSVAATELPVSIFTSILGAPFLVFLIVKGRDEL